MRRVSYAQNFEDVMLWRALSDIERGFYIDIGAWFPDIDSVTRLFSENGWVGINVEPNPNPFAQLVLQRPLDINLNVAVGDKEGEVNIRLFKGNGSGLSTLNEHYAQQHIMDGWETENKTVAQLTLSNIWSEYVKPGQPVHFLKVDVEGLEAEVLAGNDWSLNRPWVVVVEAMLPNSQVECHADWEPILIAANYIFAYADGLNRFYLAKEHSARMTAFAYPPNLFDGFVSVETYTLKQGIERSSAHIQHLENVNADLKAHINQINDERTSLIDHIKMIEKVNGERDGQGVNLDTRVDGIERRLHLVEQELQSKRQELNLKFQELNLREQKLQSTLKLIDALNSVLRAEHDEKL